MKNKLSKKLTVSIFSALLLGSFLSVPIVRAAIGVASIDGSSSNSPAYIARVQVSTLSQTSLRVSLSQASLIVGTGQSLTVMSKNGVNVYLGLNSSPAVASVSISGTQITVTGQTLGTDTVSICAVGTASDCTNLSITVQAGDILFSLGSLSLSTNSSQSVTVSGGIGTYTVWSNSNTSVASANLSGSILTVLGLTAGSTTITICDTSNTNTCGTFPVTIYSSSASSVSSTHPQTASSSYTFSQNLTIGSTGSDVIALQQILINNDFLTSVSTPTGYFGNGTQTALGKFQTENGIFPASGYFGSKTRTLLNSWSISSAQSTSAEEGQNSVQTNSTPPPTPSNTAACSGTPCNGACYNACPSGQDFVCPATGEAYCQASQQQTTDQIDALTTQCNNQMDALNQQIQAVKTKYNGLIDAYAGRPVPNKEIQIQQYENAENGQVQQLQGQEQQLYDTCQLQLNAIQ